MLYHWTHWVHHEHDDSKSQAYLPLTEQQQSEPVDKEQSRITRPKRHVRTEAPRFLADNRYPYQHTRTRARRRLYMANNGMVAEIVTMGYHLIEYVDMNGSWELCIDRRCNSANMLPRSSRVVIIMTRGGDTERY